MQNEWRLRKNVMKNECNSDNVQSAEVFKSSLAFNHSAWTFALTNFKFSDLNVLAQYPELGKQRSRHVGAIGWQIKIKNVRNRCRTFLLPQHFFLIWMRRIAWGLVGLQILHQKNQPWISHNCDTSCFRLGYSPWFHQRTMMDVKISLRVSLSQGAGIYEERK